VNENNLSTTALSSDMGWGDESADDPGWRPMSSVLFVAAAAGYWWATVLTGGGPVAYLASRCSRGRTPS
jgi:hypothetical protein